MTWTKAKFGSHLVLNRDGSERDNRGVWMPPKMQVLIPPNGQDHARPFVEFESLDPDEIVRMIFHSDRLEIDRHGQTTEVFKL